MSSDMMYPATSDPAQAPYNIYFGPDENCTLALCDPVYSIYTYRPSLGGNAAFIALFALGIVTHTVQGFWYKQWFFMNSMILGCISEIIGYIGRLILYNNPFSFIGFIIQIVTITVAPVFFCAAIYVTFTRLIRYLEPSVCWYPPRIYWWVFIPCDIVSLALQAAGGALSTDAGDGDNTGVNVSLAGLSFQVFTLAIFIVLCLDYAFRYYKFRKANPHKAYTLPIRFKVFVGFLSLATICILIRCIYRIDELSEGYSGPLIKKEGLFFGLEGVMIIVAVFFLNIGHPGPTFRAESLASQTQDPRFEKQYGFDSDSSSSPTRPVRPTRAV